MSSAEMAIRLDMMGCEPSVPVYVKGPGSCGQVPLYDKINGSPVNTGRLRTLLRADCDYIICTNLDLHGKMAWLMRTNDPLNDPSNIVRAYFSASGFILELD